jgi:hypothetical protein
MVLSLGACATNSPPSTSTSSAPTATSSAPSEIATESFFVPASDNPAIQLYVRNKHRAGVDRLTWDRDILFVHGAT